MGLPEAVIEAVLVKGLAKVANCSVNGKSLFVECGVGSKRAGEKLLGKQLFIGLGGTKVALKVKDLLLSEHSKRLTLNIKRTYNNRIILGEPIFRDHVLLLDYSKDRIGIAPKRLNFSEFFVNVVTLVRFLCFVFLLGCGFIVCYQPCRKCLRALSDRKFFTKGVGQEGRRLRQYAPIQENPY